VSHKTTEADAMRAVQRYRQITGDTDATLTRIGEKQPWYRLEGCRYRGEWFGADETCKVINAFCDGFLERRDGDPDA
jgi:hypothetical protein